MCMHKYIPPIVNESFIFTIVLYAIFTNILAPHLISIVNPNYHAVSHWKTSPAKFITKISCYTHSAESDPAIWFTLQQYY